MDFSTTHITTYGWPYPKPVVGRVCEPPPPVTTPKPQPPPVPPYCHCDLKKYGPREEQYKQLMEKELKFCKDYAALRKQIEDVTNDIIENPYDNPDLVPTSMYQATYKKRSYPITDYNQVMTALHPNAPALMQPRRENVLQCYKDPTMFQDLPAHASLPAGNKLKAQILHRAKYPGPSEYQDMYSAMAISFVKAMQKNMHPMPSLKMPPESKCVMYGKI